MLDPENAQTEQIMQIPPALLEAIHSGDIDALSATARVQLAFLMEKLTLRCATDASVTANGAASIMEVLRKIAAQSGANEDQTGPQVVINITRAKDRDDSLVIEGESKALTA